MIDVVIVTYGDRWHLLEKVLIPTVNTTLVDRIHIVSNGCTYDIQGKINGIKSGKIHLISLQQNLGSAYGYKQGILNAIRFYDSQYIYLLDDDNLPTLGTFNVLYEISKSKPTNYVYATIRENRKYMVEASKGVPTNILFPSANSFLGFNVFNFIKKKLNIFKKENIPIYIPMSPYGGFFFSKSLMKHLPDERFYLYVDDFDFTYKFTKAGIKITLLNNEAIINDIDVAWIEKHHSSPLLRIVAQNDYKAFFAARNGAYFSRNVLKNNIVHYLINKWVLLIYSGIIALSMGKLKTFIYIYKLIKDGEKGDFFNYKIANIK